MKVRSLYQVDGWPHAAGQNQNNCPRLIEDRSTTDRVSTFDLDFLSLTLTCDLDLQSQESYRVMSHTSANGQG